MSFLDRVRACRVFDPGAYRPFRVEGLAVGLVRTPFAEALAAFPEVFSVTADAVSLAAGLADCETRTAAVDAVLRRLAVDGRIPGWRDERYPVAAAWGRPPLLLMERAAVPLFGVRAAGLHVNGVVRRGDGLYLWIGRRSLERPVEPGKLDQLVAGGQPAGLTLGETLIKEAEEEAGIPAGLAAGAVPVGAITYRTERPEGLRNDILFVYDLDCPPDFTPVNADGEIEAFRLLPVDEVAAIVRDSDEFKFNCALVVIDFLIRHGRIDPSDADYLDLVAGLRSG